MTNSIVLQPRMAQIKNRLNQNGRQHVLETSRAMKSAAGRECRLYKSHSLPAIFWERSIFHVTGVRRRVFTNIPASFFPSVVTFSVNQLSQAPLNQRVESSVCRGSSTSLPADVTVIYSNCFLIKSTRAWFSIKLMEISSYNIYLS